MVAVDLTKLCGWAPGIGRVSFARLREDIESLLDSGAMRPFRLATRSAITDDVQQAFAWDDCAALGIQYPLADPLDNQEIGDCVSWGIVGVGNLLQISEIARGERTKFHPLFPPYSYWASRMTPEGGRGQLGREDGSTGAWAAEATRVYGFLRANFPNCPAYSGSVAKTWGSSRSIGDEFVADGKLHSCKTIGQITELDQLIDALRNKYWCTIASNQGFRMELQDQNGKSWFVGSDTWPHQMYYCGIDMTDESIFLMNNWGPTAHGRQLLGFNGGGWVRFKQVAGVLKTRDAECYALSGHEGYDPFPEVHWALPADIPNTPSIEDWSTRKDKPCE